MSKKYKMRGEEGPRGGGKRLSTLNWFCLGIGLIGNLSKIGLKSLRFFFFLGMFGLQETLPQARGPILKETLVHFKIKKNKTKNLVLHK